MIFTQDLLTFVCPCDKIAIRTTERTTEKRGFEAEKQQQKRLVP